MNITKYVMEISVSNFKKINHGLPLCQNNVNGVYINHFIIISRKIIGKKITALVFKFLLICLSYLELRNFGFLGICTYFSFHFFIVPRASSFLMKCYNTTICF
jgi:hypothetical protein